MAKGPILVISGTNRPGSNALKVATIVLDHYRTQGAPAELFSLADLPPEIFNPSSYATKPASFQPIQQKVLDAIGLHIVTPEYNGGFPGVLKYFIDMLKFPESFERKPVAFLAEAAGVWGGLRPVEQLQQIFGYRNAYSYPERVFIPGIAQKLDAGGRLLDEELNKRIASQTAGFWKFCQALS
jgi:chromate reductase